MDSDHSSQKPRLVVGFAAITVIAALAAGAGIVVFGVSRSTIGHTSASLILGLAAMACLAGAGLFWRARGRAGRGRPAGPRDHGNAREPGSADGSQRPGQTFRDPEASLVNAQRIARVGSWEWHIPSDQIRRSIEMCRLLGMSPMESDLTQETFLERIHSDDRAMVEEVMAAIREKGEPFDYQYRVVLPGGAVRFLHEHGEVTLDDLGKPVLAAGTTQDVTDRKRAMLGELREMYQTALSTSEARFKDFAGAASDWFWETDVDLCLTYASGRFFKILHLPLESVLGKTWRDLAGETQIAAEPEKWRAHFDDLEAHRPFRDFDYGIVGEDGMKRHVRVSGLPVFDDAGTFLGYRGSGSDVTEHKRVEAALRQREHDLEARVAELEAAQRKLQDQGADLIRLAEDLRGARDQAEAANRAKSEFLANMSHELRTPLNAIIGFSDIIRDETLGPVGSVRYRDYAKDINESGQRLLALINDILDLSKVESGTDELHETNLEISALVDSVRTLVKERAQREGVALELSCPDGLPVLRADERKVKQILVNLLSNAIKFTEAGGRVTFRTWRPAGGGHIFEIADSGIGITPEDIPKALAPFRQIEGALNRKYEGTGLGLPLAKTLTEMHGGTLELHSEIGVGTRVTLRFPVERVGGAKPIPQFRAG